MARPRVQSVEVATPERVLAAAEQVFAARGFAGATLADIGKLAGIRRPSLLYHFPTKEALYAAVVRRTFARIGALLGEAVAAPGGFEERLSALARGFATTFRERPDDARLVVREWLDPDSEGRALLVAEVVPLLDGVVAWIEAAGGDQLRPGVSVRAVVMQVVADVLLQSVAGDLREPLWGETSAERIWTLARVSLLRSRG